MSFRLTLSQFWNNVQYLLFPLVEKDVGTLSDDYKKLVAILELVRIEEFIPDSRFEPGRPTKVKPKIARAFIAKIVLKVFSTKNLIELLESDSQLRVICGWEIHSKIPDKSVFSRNFSYFAKMALPERVHQALISQAYKDKTIMHLIKDSTPIVAREKAPKRKLSRKKQKKLKDQELLKQKKDGVSRKQKQLTQSVEEMLEDLPKGCNIGAKTGTYGYKVVWKGYKLHAAVDDNAIPIAAIVTSASLNDSEAAIPLAEICNRNVTNFYDLMDSAYDVKEVKKHSLSLGHIPIIDSHSRSKEQKEEKKAEAKRRKLINFQPAELKRYRGRFSKERFNGTFKDFYGGKTIFYKGHAKISCHLMFGILSLTAAALIKLVQ